MNTKWNSNHVENIRLDIELFCPTSCEWEEYEYGIKYNSKRCYLATNL
jgi:hypothetical protein